MNTHISRILWRAVLDAPDEMVDVVLDAGRFDFAFVDDINGRSCLHEAALGGKVRLVRLCVDNGVAVGAVDVYGRLPM